LTTAEPVANFDRAFVNYPDGRVAAFTPTEFYALPLADRIGLLTRGCIRFEKGNQKISPMDALRKK
jgi:hypothetical protein